MASRPVAAHPSTREDVVMRAALRKAFSLPVVLTGLLVVGVAVFVRLNLADPEFAKPPAIVPPGEKLRNELPSRNVLTRWKLKV